MSSPPKVNNKIRRWNKDTLKLFFHRSNSSLSRTKKSSMYDTFAEGRSNETSKSTLRKGSPPHSSSETKRYASTLRSGSVSYKLNCTKREEDRRLNEIRALLSETKTKRRKKAREVFRNRHDALIRLKDLMALPQNKFAKPLYQTLVSKCPRTEISASRLICVLIDTYVFENVKMLRSVVRRVVSDMVGNPFNKMKESYYNNSKDIDDYMFDFRELCCGMRMFQRPGEDPFDTLLAMFDMFDLKNTSYIKRLDISKIFNIPVSSETEHVQMKDLTYQAFGNNYDNTISKIMFRCVLNANRELVEFFRELRQRRVPLNTRLQVCEKNMQSSSARANFVWRKLRWRSVRSFYERHCLAGNLVGRWNCWKSYVEERRMIKRAAAYHVKFCKRKGLRYFHKFVMWRCEQRRLRLKARSHFENYTLTYRFYEWYRFHDESKRRRIENMKIAADFHRKRALRKYKLMWSLFVMNIKAEKFCVRMTKIKALNAWIYFCHLEQERRIQMEREAQERLVRLQAEINATNEESERILMQKEEVRMRDLIRLEEIEILQKQRDAEYAMKLDYATYRANQRRVRRRQIENRIENKRTKLRTEKRNFQNTWMNLGDKSMNSTKNDTLNWIKNTTEGRTTIKVNADMIYKYWNDCIEGFETPEMALWQGIYDPIYGTIFFFNVETKERIGTKTFTREQAKMVAIDHYLARQMKTNIETTREIKAREKQLALENKCARYVQMMWRSRKSRKMMKEIVRRMYDVRYDIDTGDMYYYHILKRTKQQIKPRIMGHDKLEPPDYARVRNEKNVPMYYDTKRPWLSSEEKPKGYLQCTECNFFFARRYCKNCKEHFCIDCHWKCHSKGKRRFHEWDRFDVKVQKCDVCRVQTATVLCHACDGSMYCQKCCDMVHSARNKRKHDLHDF